MTTHLGGLVIGQGAGSTVTKLAAKHRRQREFAERHLHLPDFMLRFMFWSPVVRRGLVKELEVTGFELFINKNYTDAIEQLRKKAKNSTADFNNPAFRVLQFRTHAARPTAIVGPFVLTRAREDGRQGLSQALPSPFNARSLSKAR